MYVHVHVYILGTRGADLGFCRVERGGGGGRDTNLRKQGQGPCTLDLLRIVYVLVEGGGGALFFKRIMILFFFNVNIVCFSMSS